MKYPQRIGGYEIVGQLALGRTTQLLLARSPASASLRRTVAIKWLRAEIAHHGPLVRVLLAEARIAGRMAHPFIAQVHEIDQDDGRYYMAMEYVRGWSLRAISMAARRAKRPLPYIVAMTIVHHAASALHHVHEATGPEGRPLGLVHRDVSPANLIVGDQGFTKLVDFGAASQPGGDPLSLSTPPYLAPEQVRTLRDGTRAAATSAVDRRADVFALGMLLYELTCGLRAADGASDIASFSPARIPRPADVRPSYPRELNDVVMTALDPSPLRRYEDCVRLQEHLELASARMGVALSPNRVARYLRGLVGNDDPIRSPARRAPSVSTPVPNFQKTTVRVDRSEGENTRPGSRASRASATRPPDRPAPPRAATAPGSSPPTRAASSPRGSAPPRRAAHTIPRASVTQPLGTRAPPSAHPRPSGPLAEGSGAFPPNAVRQRAAARAAGRRSVPGDLARGPTAPATPRRAEPATPRAAAPATPHIDAPDAAQRAAEAELERLLSRSASQPLAPAAPARRDDDPRGLVPRYQLADAALRIVGGRRRDK